MNETLGVIESLRTVHGNFTDELISESDIDTIIDATLHTANASARQSYSIIVIDKKDEMDAICSYKGSHVFVFCIDYTRLKETAHVLDCEFDNDNIVGFITGAVDTILAAQTAVIAAKSLGIDSLITNGLHRKNLNDVYEILKLPQTSCFPLIAVVFGYNAKEETPKKGRLGRDYLIHRNEYRHLSNQQLLNSISEYDDKIKHIGLIDNWEEMGYKHYLDWFYNKWTGKPNKEKVIEGKIKEFQERLITSGFWYS
jgi:FMN reductase [NAD(P)H]